MKQMASSQLLDWCSGGGGGGPWEVGEYDADRLLAQAARVVRAKRRRVRLNLREWKRCLLVKPNVVITGQIKFNDYWPNQV